MLIAARILRNGDRPARNSLGPFAASYADEDKSDPRQSSIAPCIRKPAHDGHLTVTAIFFEITGGLNR
jgi:hypothetical protein